MAPNRSHPLTLNPSRARSRRKVFSGGKPAPLRLFSQDQHGTYDRNPKIVRVDIKTGEDPLHKRYKAWGKDFLDNEVVLCYQQGSNEIYNIRRYHRFKVPSNEIFNFASRILTSDSRSNLLFIFELCRHDKQEETISMVSEHCIQNIKGLLTATGAFPKLIDHRWISLCMRQILNGTISLVKLGVRHQRISTRNLLFAENGDLKLGGLHFFTPLVPPEFSSCREDIAQVAKEMMAGISSSCQTDSRHRLILHILFPSHFDCPDFDDPEIRRNPRNHPDMPKEDNPNHPDYFPIPFDWDEKNSDSLINSLQKARMLFENPNDYIDPTEVRLALGFSKIQVMSHLELYKNNLSRQESLEVELPDLFSFTPLARPDALKLHSRARDERKRRYRDEASGTTQRVHMPRSHSSVD